MKKFNCKDYYIIKIRVYASKYLLDKSDKNNLPLPEQHSERAMQYHVFFWQLFEKFIGITQRDWRLKYFGDGLSCAYEELEERFGILQSDAEGERIFIIPKEHEEIFEWIKENVNLPYKVIKILKHIPLRFRFFDHKLVKGTSLRKISEEWTKANIKKED